MAETHYTPIQLGKNAATLHGQQFGRLKAIAPISRNKNGQIFWLCLCDCGNHHATISTNLKRGLCLSCGCLHREIIGQVNVKHGMADTPIHKIWMGMIDRCANSRTPTYKRYGARGITVCERWLNSFEAFYSDMGERPSSSHTLDRIDNDGPYAPDNCRWATSAMQARNRRNNRLITHNGETKCMAEWAEQYGMKPYTIHERLRRGWSFEKAISVPVRKGNYSNH